MPYLQGNYLPECLIYKAPISMTTNEYCYGTCENTFKERYNNHKRVLRNVYHEKNSEFSKYVQESRERDTHRERETETERQRDRETERD